MNTDLCENHMLIQVEMDMLDSLCVDDVDINVLVKSFKKYGYRFVHVKLFILAYVNYYAHRYTPTVTPYLVVACKDLRQRPLG